MAIRIPRIVGPSLLLVHFLSHFSPLNPSKLSELYLYNAIPCFAIIVVLSAQRISDPLSKPLLITAISLWLFGSILASTASFYSLPEVSSLISNTAYLLFYPCAVIALPRLINSSRKSTVLEIFDASIVGLGLSVLGTTFALKPVLPHFGGKLSDALFALTFPVCDLILISMTIATIASHGWSQRSIIICLGVLTFTFTDFLFLWQALQRTYLGIQQRQSYRRKGS